VSIDILASDFGAGAPASRRSPWRAALIGLVVVLVLALIGGVAVAVRGLSGGGTQPEQVLPAGAFAFAKVDLDPPAGQKIDAVRFMRKFPALRDKVSVDADLRKALFEGVADQAGWSKIDYAKDVEPWLGQRIGVAAYKGAGGPVASPSGMATAVVALQIKDAGKAKAGIARLVQATPGSPALGVKVTEGFALLGASQAVVDKAAKDADRGTVASDPKFSKDMSDLGDGIAAAWVDMDSASSVLGLGMAGLGGVGGLGGLGALGSTAGASGSAGRMSYVLKFDGPDALEVRGLSTGGTPLPGSDKPLSGFTDLPAGSLAAFGLVGGDRMVPVMFASLRASLNKAGGPGGATFDEMVAEAEKSLGISLPEDLAVLLGSNLVASLDGLSASGEDIQLGAKVTTNGAKAEAVLAKLQRAARAHGEDLPIYHRRTADGVVVASSKAEAARLLRSGTLGDDPAFRKAMPDVEGANMAVWVDVAGLATVFTGEGSVDKNLEPIDGVGMTVHLHSGGGSVLRMRLVAH
jgi:uncharacterized protein DUF3352